MTDSTTTEITPSQRVARELAVSMGGYDESGFGDSEFESILSPRQKALVADAFGLLNGVSLGTISVGQPRIRDNLVEIIQSLPAGVDQVVAGKLSRVLNSVLSRAGSAGLTADHQPLAPTRQPTRSR